MEVGIALLLAVGIPILIFFVIWLTVKILKGTYAAGKFAAKGGGKLAKSVTEVSVRGGGKLAKSVAKAGVKGVSYGIHTAKEAHKKKQYEKTAFETDDADLMRESAEYFLAQDNTSQFLTLVRRILETGGSLNKAVKPGDYATLVSGGFTDDAIGLCRLIQGARPNAKSWKRLLNTW